MSKLLLRCLPVCLALCGAPALQAQTTAEDHRRTLEALGIDHLRPGADSRATQGPTAPNYDESRANAITNLPDPLRFESGKPVRSARQWKQRREELLEIYDREIYGRVPRKLPKVQWLSQSDEATVQDGVPVRRTLLHGVVAEAGNPAPPVVIELELTVPAGTLKRVPVVLELGFVGPSPFAARPEPGMASWQRQILDRGWGYAIVAPRSIQADNGAGLRQGIVGLGNRGRPRGLEDWGALRAWAWGASRALDFFEHDPRVDAHRVAVEGLSRYGKAALVAMAYDERFAIGFIASSGQGGAKLQRRDYGERVENLTAEGQYHWMAGNYLKYGGPLTPADLPVDAHELIALCAPRPVFVSVGSPQIESGWIDGRGMFMAEVAASPVYALLGAKGLGTTDYPEPLELLAGGELAFRAHTGGHTAGPNWPSFLDFAARYFDRSKR